MERFNSLFRKYWQLFSIEIQAFIFQGRHFQFQTLAKQQSVDLTLPLEMKSSHTKYDPPDMVFHTIRNVRPPNHCIAWVW